MSYIGGIMEKSIIKLFKKVFLKYHYFLTLIAVCAYPCFFMAFLNVGEVDISCVELPFVTYLCMGILLFCFCFIIIKDFTKTVFVASVIQIVLCNYVVINKTINMFVYCNYIAQTIIMVLLLVLISLVVKFKKIKIDYKTLCDIILVVVCLLLVVDGIMAGVKIYNSNQVQKKDLKIVSNKDSDKNIYYLLFDEYGGEENLKHYFDFDNKELYDYFGKNNFEVYKGTHNFESIYTQEIVPNILNLDYVAKVDGLASANVELAKNARIFTFLKEKGYEIDMVNDGGFLCDEGCNIVGGDHYKPLNDEKKMIQAIFNQGVISLAIDLFSDREYNFEQRKQSVQIKQGLFDSYYEECKAGGNKKLLIGYICLPHGPFVFNHDGTVSDNNMVDDYKYYIEQLKYVNMEIQRIVDKILKEDPNSIIVIQSDHGARYALANLGDYKKSEYDEIKETEMMQNVINCVYIGGEKVSLKQKNTSSINTWRMILNKEFGTELDEIEAEKYILHWKVNVE